MQSHEWNDTRKLSVI